MSYEVLARRWRPQSFADVVGQDHVARTLQNAIRSGRIAHAYLFVGARGTGKTSIARIMAKALNCAKGPTDTPCGVCNSCVEIVAGSSLDVIEVDAASNRGIDEIRALRENVQYMPHGRFRIYIIDEVHQLTSEAFNAMLKTLEEPPSHVKFFFATTEAHKLPITILSRCQRFDLRRIPEALIAERLQVIAQAESVTVEPAALEALARNAEGCLRDAESALDQMIASQGDVIKEGDVLSVFGLVSRKAVTELAGYLLAGDIVRTIEQIGELERQGKVMSRLLMELVEHFRNLLIFIEVGERIKTLDIGALDIETLSAHAANAKSGRVLRMIDTLLETFDGLPRALTPITWVETGFIRCIRLSSVASVDELLAQVREWRAELGSSTDAAVRPAASPERPRQPVQPLLQPQPQPVSPAAPRPQNAGAGDLDMLKAQWRDIAQRAGNISSMVKGYLMDGQPAEVAADQVVLVYAPEFADRAELAGSSRNRPIIQKVLSDALGRDVTVVFKAETAPDASGNGNDRTTASGSARRGASASSAVREKWMQNEAVDKTAKAFKARVTDVKE